MSLRINILESYPEQLKDYVNDYNKGVDNRDVMEIDLAINSLVTSVFSSDEDIKQYSVQILAKIGEVQYKFLKNAMKVLIHRYKGDDPVKSDIASTALGQIVVGKPPAQLVDDESLLNKIISEERERLSRSKADDIRRQQYLTKVQSVQVDLSAIQAFPEVYKTGLYYNKCLVDDKSDEAFQSIQGLIGNLFTWFEKDQKNFTAGCMFLNIIGSESKRQELFTGVIDYLMGYLNKGKSSEKAIVQEIFLQIYETVQDLLNEDFVNWLRAESIKRGEEREKHLQEETERRKFLQKVSVTPKLKWAVEIQKLAKEYNEAIGSNNQKALNQVKKNIEKSIESNDEMIWRSTGELISILLTKVPDYIQEIINKLLNQYRDQKYSEILSFMLEDLGTLELTKPQIIEAIKEDQEARELERERIRKEKEEEREKIDKITIKFEGDWEKNTIKMIEKMNAMFLKKNEPAVAKIINTELKEILQAKDDIIRSQAQEIFIRLANKYPDLLKEIVQEYVELFKSENPARFIVVETFGKTYHAGIIEKILPEISDELKKQIETDYDDRRKEIDNLHMVEKISHIKIDVQTLPIADEWPKDIQKICRVYNDAILKQDMQSVVEQVKKIVDIFMNEKKEQRLNSSIDVLGKIAKKNIELIAPTIDMLLEMVDSENLETKFKGIKALGEVTVKRPGWAYMGIEKLMNTARHDSNDDARMKAMLELSRIGKKNATMLIEYVPDIIDALSNDQNKHVRRLAAWTLGSMAEAIPLEAKDAIPALTEALHDDYILVRKFADKALQLIRQAMRKED